MLGKVSSSTCYGLPKPDWGQRRPNLVHIMDAQWANVSDFSTEQSTVRAAHLQCKFAR